MMKWFVIMAVLLVAFFFIKKGGCGCCGKK